MDDIRREPTDVYLAYDREGRLLYVGITLGFRSRMGTHRASSEWWPETTRLEVEHYPDRRAALARESEVIGTLVPPYNSTAHVLRRHRDDRIVRYRELGLTNWQIARKEGMSGESIERVIKRLLAEGRIQVRRGGRPKKGTTP